ncbi:MAG: hypothetical protein OXT67_00020, partial [Zetaproteobacteria bacterium]|nr:hypothetical protein [Zetaproteobacteria bacterium]
YKYMAFSKISLEKKSFNAARMIATQSLQEGICASKSFFLCTHVQQFLNRPVMEVVIVGTYDNLKTRVVVDKIRQQNYFHIVLIAGEDVSPHSPLPLLRFKSRLKGQDGSIFVCEDSVCRFPTTDVGRAFKLIEMD